jgi:betaine-aldehyde dehydrogenase
MENVRHLYINGAWRIGQGKKRRIINPANEIVLWEINDASKEQANEAVEVARHVFDHTDWALNEKKRIKVLRQVADLLINDAENVAEIETSNTGKPIRESRIDVEDTVSCLRYYADLVESRTPWQKKMEDGSMSTVFHEPIGVCSLVVPWNFPLLLGIWKIAPALAAGNTVVFKPSELTPLSMIRFTELLEKAGLPKGVFNLVLGEGNPVGEILVSHPRVDKVSFTGGSETGRKINETCAKSLKRVSLELGGKSPLIVMEDTDIDKAVEWILYGGFFNQGEVCVASSRILIHESIYSSVINRLKEKMGLIKIGNPMDDTTEMGPIISRSHLEKIKNYLSSGVEEGATLIGGQELGHSGFYLQPAIFVDVEQNMRIVQEEIFGPVLTIQSFEDEEEAIAFANGTKYGLAAGILSGDSRRAKRMASRFKAGTVWVNNYHTPYVEAPWGGYKQSGIGRELGPQGLAAFSEIKHVNETESLEAPGWYRF